MFVWSLPVDAALLDILSPTPGDKLVIGENYRVKWEDNSGFKVAAIYLGSCYLDIVSLDKGYYDLKVPSYCSSRSFKINPGDYTLAMYLGEGKESDSIHNAVYMDNIHVVSSSDMDPEPVNGSCGEANGQAFKDINSLTQSHLCKSGHSIGVKSSDGSWVCRGDFGGEDVTCKAIVGKSVEVLTGVKSDEEWSLSAKKGRIAWKAYFMQKIDISLCVDNQCAIVLERGIDASKGSYEWNYGAMSGRLVEGVKYRVKISDSAMPSVAGYSNFGIYFVSKNNDLSYASYEVKDEKQQTVPKSTLSSQEREKLIIMIKGLIRDRQQRDYGSMTLMGKEFGRSVRLVTKIEVENKEISLGSVKSDSAGYLYFKTSWGEYGIRSFKIEGDKVIDVDFLASSGIYDYVIEGDRLYTVEVNGMQVYSLKEGKMTKEASVFSQNFISIVVNDGIIYVGGKNGLYAYRVEGRTFKEIDHIMIYNINDIWGDNGYIYINNQGKGEMVVCKLIEDKFSKVSVLTELDFGIKKSSFVDLPFTVKNNRLILSALGSIYSYDMKDGKIAEKVGIIGDSAGSNLLIHNEWLYVFDRTRNFLLVYDMNKNKEVISFNVGEYVHEIYVDDNYLIVNYNDKVEVFEIK